MKEFGSVNQLEEYLSKSAVEEIAVQNVDLTQLKEIILKKRFKDCIFLGCEMDDAIRLHLFEENYIFPKLDVPFDIYPNELYNKATLYNDYNYNEPDSYKQCLDKVIYDHYIREGKEAKSIKQTLARRLHDHSITGALTDFLETFDERKVVAVMGGHSMSRKDDSYKQICQLAKQLTEEGYLMVSGGGPGAMEATNLGAWLAGKQAKDLDAALDMLAAAPKYSDKGWLPAAFKVLEKYSSTDYSSIGIPTWYYGHEPPSPFATHIAKYFANSVREEGLLAIAKGGIVFAPGSAGTMQEIFQEVAQNHYKSFGYASPMVFMNKEYWSYDRPIYPLLELMKLRANLENLDIGVYDDNKSIIEHLKSFEF